MKKAAPLLVIAAGLCWGCIGIFVRRLNALGLESMGVVALRAVFTAVIMLVGVLIYDRKLLKVKLRDLWCFAGTGILSVNFFNYCYFRTIAISSLSVAAILLYTAPVMVMLMSAALFREKITKRKLLAVLSAFFGCGLVTGALGAGLTLSPKALLVGLGAGFGYALYSIFGRCALLRGYGSITITTYTFLFAAVSLIPLAPCRQVAAVAFAGWGSFFFCLVFALLSTVVPYLCYTLGLSFMEAGKASVIASVEPVMATVVGVAVFHESIGLSGICGIAMVLLAVALLRERSGEKQEAA